MVSQEEIQAAVSSFQQGNLDRCETICREILAKEPDQIAALQQLALVYFQKKQIDRARELYEEILSRKPGAVETRFNLGILLKMQGNAPEAETCFRQVIDQNPAYTEAHLGLGVVLQEQGRTEPALRSYQTVLARDPDHVEALIGVGLILTEQKQMDKALAVYQKAVSLAPRHIEALKGLGMVRKEMGRFEEALAVYDRILTLSPDHIETRLGIGNTCKAKGDLAEAVNHYRQTVSLHPDYARARLFLGLALLLKGNFAEGWREYEWRWRTEPLLSQEKNYPHPVWDGSPLNGKTILLHSEQGYGDTIQFVRYIPLVKQRGAAGILLACEGKLIRLLSGFPHVDAIVDKKDPLPEADVRASLLNLPRIFNTDLETIPEDIPYLTADADRVQHWRERLGQEGTVKVGLVWAGNPSHKKDHLRSIPVHALHPLFQIPGVQCYSLQVGERAIGAEGCAACGTLIDLSGELTDFAETAAAITALDLVISVDTAVAHLAGALGRPVWTLLPFVPDWRWLMNRPDSPWYPTMRLFRQSAHDQWKPVLEQVEQELNRLARNRGTAAEPDTSGPVSPDTEPVTADPEPESPADRKTEMNTSLHSGDITRLKPCRHGMMLYLRNDRYVGRSLDLYGEFSEGEVELFRQLIRPGDVVVEAGANLGAHTVFLARTVGTSGAVVAYEPQRFIHQILCANVALNELTNVHTRQAALGKTPGRTMIPVFDYQQTYNFGGVSMTGRQNGELVPVETIDGLRLPRVRLIKADVEGMETDVIAGGRETIRRLRPVLYVENDRREKSPELIRMIQELDYRLWWHLPPLFNPQNFTGNPENVFGTIVSVNLLCLPREVASNITGLREVTGPEDNWRVR